MNATSAREAFEQLPAKLREQALLRAQILRDVRDEDPSRSKMERYRRIAARWGFSVRQIRRWAARIKGINDPQDWAPALAASGYGGRPKVEMDDRVFEYIKAEFLTQSRPALKPIYRRAIKKFALEGITIPSYRTVKRRLENLPHAATVFLREGKKALADLYPSQQRDYSDLALHDQWCSDGRKADVVCRWPDGYAGRPILMGWQEVRTRKVLGWAVRKTEDADLTRLSFHDAASKSRALPRRVLIDNGRAYASKQITGGQPTRNRFKVNPDDPYGILTVLQIDAIWATPYNGRAKPIESFWNVVAEAEKCAEFAGAYCGNRPDAKPEEFDPKNAIPIEQYIDLVCRTIEEKNAQPHRGDSMDGRSPDALYAELMATTPVRHPTPWQLRQCLMVAEGVRLDREGCIRILGNRYWTRELADLPRRGTYTARYNPDDPSAVLVYDGEKYLCEVPRIEKTHFANRGAAKEYARAKRQFVKSQREAARSLVGMGEALRSWERPAVAQPASPQSPQSPQAPAPRVSMLVPTRLQRNRAEVDRCEPERPDRFTEIMEQRMADDPRMRAAGGGF